MADYDKARYKDLENNSSRAKNETSMFVRTRHNVGYNARLILGTALIAVLAYGTTYLAKTTMNVQKNLDIIAKVTKVMQDENGNVPPKKLEELFSDLRIPFQVKEGDLPDLTPQYNSPVELYILRDKKRIKVGETDIPQLKSYIANHPKK